jgi:hypothetical protein
VTGVGVVVWVRSPPGVPPVRLNCLRTAPTTCSVTAVLDLRLVLRLRSSHTGRKAARCYDQGALAGTVSRNP